LQFAIADLRLSERRNRQLQSQIANRNRKSQIIMQNPPFITAKRRVHRKRRSDVSSAPAALVLVSGVYISAASVRLTFDRDIDISAIDTTVFIVNDNDDVGEKFEGQGPATLLDPQTVQITLVPAGGPSGSGITLTASASNGIVAVDDGGAWAGVIDFPLNVP
jgi:hypothetical protein